jgi:uncharacterized membrane protein YidH (DUF202 family)
MLFQFRRHFNPAFPCQKQWVAWNCLIVRAPIFIRFVFQINLISLSFTSYTLLHAGITVERLTATLTVRRYEQTSGRLAAAILTCIAITSSAHAFYMLRSVDWHRTHDYCSLSSIPTLGSLSAVITILAFVNIPIICIDLALFSINGQQLNRLALLFKLQELLGQSITP